ncbi:NAD(P)/FAD-dependent oxidoreductase [Amaricoccus tamworthensis]|uniref:NAD(P)/FAD-dependent oxidoreductase n=1 Tax=Amaricoccus tamworthensis TaxID=57002 RepID=UPI003C7DE34F
MAEFFTKDFRAAPYWWDRYPLDDRTAPDLPNRSDAVVIGSGYTGLHAALQIARAGRSVIVLERDALGQGCSTRNGGQISISIKSDLKELTVKHGADTARRILQDGHASRAYIEEFVKTEGLDCDFRTSGRFHAAHSAAAFRDLRATIENQPKEFERQITLIPRTEQRRELGTDFYHGGAVYHDVAEIDPGRYHAGLIALCRKAGVSIHPKTPATLLDSDHKGATVTTPRGPIKTRDVVIATNGYSGDLSPWHRRRIIPIGSYIIATEVLPSDLIDGLFPTGRLVSDSRRVVYYYRTSPDRRRILFGGRVSAGETDTRASARRLRDEMIRIFPELAGYQISHSWMGFVGYTFDTLPHMGRQDRVHHAMGYCGAGVGMASYLGMKTGLAVLGDPEGTTGLEKTAFPPRPLYNGKPWFLPAAVEYYRLRDRLGLS